MNQSRLESFMRDRVPHFRGSVVNLREDNRILPTSSRRGTETTSCGDVRRALCSLRRMQWTVNSAC
jgi:hypothetical protein